MYFPNAYGTDKASLHRAHTLVQTFELSGWPRCLRRQTQEFIKHFGTCVLYWVFWSHEWRAWVRIPFLTVMFCVIFPNAYSSDKVFIVPHVSAVNLSCSRLATDVGSKAARTSQGLLTFGIGTCVLSLENSGLRMEAWDRIPLSDSHVLRYISQCFILCVFQSISSLPHEKCSV